MHWSICQEKFIFLQLDSFPLLTREPLIYSIENKLRSIPNLFGATIPYFRMKRV